MNLKVKRAGLKLIYFGFFLTALFCCIKEAEKIEIKDQNTLNIISCVQSKTTVNVKNIMYNRDGIEAQYPQLVRGGSDEQLRKWNDIIQEDFNKIINIYSFNPFPEPTPAMTKSIPIILKIQYEMKANNDQFVSILYKAAFNSPYSAHPSELVYTTNISKKDNKRIKLSDLVNIDKGFVKDFRTWSFKPIEEGNNELNQAIKDYVAHLSDEDLLLGFRAADMIGSKNLWGIYSYINDDKLGISLGVPNYAGDHVEFEKEFAKIKQYLK